MIRAEGVAKNVPWPGSELREGLEPFMPLAVTFRNDRARDPSIPKFNNRVKMLTTDQKVWGSSPYTCGS